MARIWSQYMAPEQFSGAAASLRSDIYALGLILFEVFTGKRAQDSKTLDWTLAPSSRRAIAPHGTIIQRDV